MAKLVSTFFLASFVCIFTGFGQVRTDTSILARIKSAANTHSSIAECITNLADLNGPRLLGTVNYYKSAQWAKQKLLVNGVDSAWFQSFDKRYRGWKVRSFNMEMTKPAYMHITAYTLAYTQSTKGEISGEVVVLENRLTAEKLKGQLKGKIVLMTEGYRSFDALQQVVSGRLSNELLQQAAANPDPNDLMIGYHSRRSTNQAIRGQENRRDNMKAFFEFCEKEGVVALIEPSSYPYGILHVDGNHNIPSYRKVEEIKPVASFVVANEHFGRLSRLVRQGVVPTVRLHLDAEYNYHPEYNVNVIADIKGVDDRLSEEQVIIGAHLDSWHGGTGAVDNAAGCAVMVEAMRILVAAGLKPRRRIRIALWGGEEQIFAGSREYVNTRVGNLSTGEPKYDFSRLSAYFNMDNGTGKIRGIYAQGNTKVKPIFEKYLAPFKDVGNGTVAIQNANQTDHELFDALNIPAFQFIQDPLNYITAVHHTNLDVAEYVNHYDLRESAIIVAFLAYQVAMSDSLLPRKDYVSIEPSRKGSTSFFLEGFENARSVSIVSNFNNWNMFGTPLAKVNGGWTCQLDLKPGRYLYQYIVDGHWTPDPKTASKKLLQDGEGHSELTELIVK